MKTVYMGNFEEVFSALHASTELQFVLMEKGKISEKINKLCISVGIPIYIIDKESDLDAIKSTESICFISSFTQILKKNHIKNFRKVINIHPGDTLTCRGRHPLPFAIVKKLNQMCLTGHTIDSEEIDAGEIIMQTFLPINYSQSYKYNERRLRSVLYNFTVTLVQLIQSPDFYSARIFQKDLHPYNKRLTSEQLSIIFESQTLEG